MNRRTRTALALFMTSLVGLAVVMLFPNQILTPMANLDYRACLKIEKGMSEARVIERMGQPHSREAYASGEKTFYYGWRQMDLGPVNIVLKDHGAGYVVDYAACRTHFIVD